MSKRLGPPGQEYATVWRLPIPFTNLSVRLHHWYGADDSRAYHSHPQWFCTLVLWGGYNDVAQIPLLTTTKDYGRQVVTTTHHVRWWDHFDKLGWLSMRLRPATWRHYVVPRTRHVWTLLLFGGPKRHWDFYRVSDGKRFKRDKWFAEHGHHTQDGSPPVRLRPDGTVIKEVA